MDICLFNFFSFEKFVLFFKVEVIIGQILKKKYVYKLKKENMKKNRIESITKRILIFI